ncbi:MAG: hypothetical protein ACLVGR_01390 [Anaerovoracaceae bacterium]
MNEYARAFKEALLSRGEMKTVFKMGYPVGIQMALESSTFTFAAVMAGWLGSSNWRLTKWSSPSRSSSS